MSTEGAEALLEAADSLTMRPPKERREPEAPPPAGLDWDPENPVVPDHKMASYEAIAAGVLAENVDNPRG